MVGESGTFLFKIQYCILYKSTQNIHRFLGYVCSSSTTAFPIFNEPAMEGGMQTVDASINAIICVLHLSFFHIFSSLQVAPTYFSLLTFVNPISHIKEKTIISLYYIHLSPGFMENSEEEEKRCV